ncbi:hypothetical protein EDB85DRAFT_1892802 [Lactarius pseudohatsudake]|nr:hypothetical protein EDB85DRAFT_1892802 [Lactarius pseudohatsudake]
MEEVAEAIAAPSCTRATGPFIPAPTPRHRKPTTPPQHGMQDLDRPPTSTPPQNGTLTPHHVAQHPANPPCPFKAAHTAQPPPTPMPPQHVCNTPPPADSPLRQDPTTADLPRRPIAAHNTLPPTDSPPRRANMARPRGKRGNSTQLS